MKRDSTKRADEKPHTTAMLTSTKFKSRPIEKLDLLVAEFESLIAAMTFVPDSVSIRSGLVGLAERIKNDLAETADQLRGEIVGNEPAAGQKSRHMSAKSAEVIPGGATRQTSFAELFAQLERLPNDTSHTVMVPVTMDVHNWIHVLELSKGYDVPVAKVMEHWVQVGEGFREESFAEFIGKS